MKRFWVVRGSLTLLLWTLSLLSWQFATRHGAFGPRPTEIPFSFQTSPFRSEFRISARGPHDIELQVPAAKGSEIKKDFFELNGIFRLTTDDTVVTVGYLPTGQRRYRRNSVAIVLATFDAKREAKYTLYLDFQHLPDSLRNNSTVGAVVVEPHSYKVLSVVCLSASVLAIAGAVVIAISAIQAYAAQKSDARRATRT